MDPVVELKATLKSVEEMTGQAQALMREFNERPPQSSEEVPAMPHAIAGAELVALDHRCESALREALPDNPKLIDDLHAPSDEGSSGPEVVLTNLKKKRETLVHALNILDATPPAEKPKSKWRKAWERVKIIPDAVGYIGSVGTGGVLLVGIVLAIAHWALGLF